MGVNYEKNFLIIFKLLIPTNVFATSGRLRQDSIISCNNQTYGQHGNDNHWHLAESHGEYWYPVGKELAKNPCEGYFNQENNSTDNNNYYTETKIISKSSDTSLKSVKINNESIVISEKMKYSIDTDNIDIKVETTDTKSNINISDNYKNLDIGNNKIIITITAEDYTQKEYILDVYRKSNNTNINLRYNNEIIKFNDFVSKTIYTDEENIKFDIITEDNKTTTNTKNSYKLKKGDNEIKIKVTAENNDSKVYRIKVHRYTVLENIIFTVIVFFYLLAFFVIAVIAIRLKQKEKNKLKKCNFCNNIIKKDDIFCPYCGNKIH